MTTVLEMRVARIAALKELLVMLHRSRQELDDQIERLQGELERHERLLP